MRHMAVLSHLNVVPLTKPSATSLESTCMISNRSVCDGNMLKELPYELCSMHGFVMQLVCLKVLEPMVLLPCHVI